MGPCHWKSACPRSPMWFSSTASTRDRYAYRSGVVDSDRVQAGATLSTMTSALDSAIPPGFLRNMQCGSIVGYGGTDGSRSVKVQVTVSEPDPPIGLLARNTFRRKYYEPGEVVRVLKIDGRILGKITGSIMFEPGKVDLGLNLKVRGKYVLPDYVRRKTVEGAEGANAWAQGVDSVRIVGSAVRPLLTARGFHSP